MGITHSKKNFDEISLVSFEREICRKFVFKNNHLIGLLVLGKEINKKALKPILKKAVLNQVIIQDLKRLLLEIDIDFNVIVDEIEGLI